MCGIIGYSGSKQSVTFLINGLKALEYRGYDSAGLVIESEQGLELIHAVGKVAALEEKTLKQNPQGVTGIAHTRWATHGKPTEKNSHPHTDCTGDIAVVHNGIIENYLTIKENLIKMGHKFGSETDTEVIAHFLEEKLKNVTSGYEEAMLKAVSELPAELDGSFALAIVWSKTQGVVFGTRKKSPLVLGLGDGENFIGSDVSAFSDHTLKAAYIDDGDIIVIKKDAAFIYDCNCKQKNYSVITLEASGGDSGKNGFEHYMRKEIFEQPSSVRKTTESVMVDIDSAFGIKPDDLKGIRNIMMVGCGTAYHATMVAKYWMEEFTNIPTQAELASEYKYRNAAMPKETLAVFVSQSGETADTVAALEKAKTAGFKSIAICNVFGSTIARSSDFTFFTKCGREISVASTKAFTSQLAALYSLAVFIGRVTGNISKQQEDELMSDLARVPHAIDDAIEQETTIKEIAEKYYKRAMFVFLGRNVNFPLALEGALKLKEISYLHAEGFAAGEIKHGPIALIDEGTPVISIMPYEQLFDKMVNACQEVMARGAKPIAITDRKGAAQLKGKIEDIIVLKETHPAVFPLVNAVALQLLAYHVARLNGREIDQPRNLAKSVTVE